MNLLNKIIEAYKSIDRRSPMEIEIDNIRKIGGENVEEVERYLKQSKRFILIDKHHQICGVYNFDILDRISGLLYKNISYSGVFRICKNLNQ